MIERRPGGDAAGRVAGLLVFDNGWSSLVINKGWYVVSTATVLIYIHNDVVFAVRGVSSIGWSVEGQRADRTTSNFANSDVDDGTRQCQWDLTVTLEGSICLFFCELSSLLWQGLEKLEPPKSKTQITHLSLWSLCSILISESIKFHRG